VVCFRRSLLFGTMMFSHRPTELSAGVSSPFAASAPVRRTADFERISALPRRVYSADQKAALVDKWTKRFRAAGGQMTLLEQQAIGLEEFEQTSGLIASLGCGAGKTLLFFLLPALCPDRKAVLIVPAKDIGTGKTQADYLALSKDWRLPPCPELVSYEAFGPVSGKKLLAKLKPGLLLLDELHKVANRKASRTRRIERYLKEADCLVAAGTGTLTKRRLSDYSHVMLWALGVGAPVPISREVVDEWDSALAEKLELGVRLRPGALLEWPIPEGEEPIDDLSRGRLAFQRRLSETPGVVIFSTSDDIDSELHINGYQIDYPNESTVGAAFRRLRTAWELPDGQELVSAIELYRSGKTLGLGFYQHWKDPAPTEWLSARKGWFSACREMLSRSRAYDSPDEVAKQNPSMPEWQRWLAVRASYKPNSVPVWLDLSAAKICADWLARGGVAFCEHVWFGRMVASLAKVPYFGAGGIDEDTGRSINDYRGPALVASLRSSGEGLCLHRYSRALVPSSPPNGVGWEQLLARLHRRRQEAEVVTFDLLFGSKEAYSSFWQAARDKTYFGQVTGAKQKLHRAKIDVAKCPLVGYQWTADTRVV